MLSSCSASEEPLSFPLLIVLAMAICACCFLLAIFILRVKEACFDSELSTDSEDDIEALPNYEEEPPACCVKAYGDIEEQEAGAMDEQA